MQPLHIVTQQIAHEKFPIISSSGKKKNEKKKKRKKKAQESYSSVSLQKFFQYASVGTQWPNFHVILPSDYFLKL